MARSAVTVNKMLKYNTGYASTGDAIDLTNDHVIDISEIKDENLLIVIENATAIVGTATLLASDVYSEASVGDLVLAIGANAVVAVAVESARFKDSDGNINLDMASAGALTGRIYATSLPA